MALPTRVVRDTTTALDDYKAGVGGAATKWLDGVKNPRADFRVRGAASEAEWFAGVQTAHAAQSFSKNLGKVSDAFYLNAVETYGQSNYSTQAVAKASKWGTFYGKFRPVLESTITSLDKSNPRGSYAQNKARQNAYTDALHAKKGQFKA